LAVAPIRKLAELASRRAAELILQLAGGELLSGVVDSYPPSAPRRNPRDARRDSRVMGADVPDKQVEAASARSASRPFESTRTAARRARSSRPGNVRNHPGAPKSSAKSI